MSRPKDRTLKLISIAAGLLTAICLPAISQAIPTGSGIRAIQADPPQNRPDLIVRISGPRVAFAGQDIGRMIRLIAGNRGHAIAPGTRGALDPANGYMIDVVLSSDAPLPAGFAIYSPNWAEDVLLRGGRVSNTLDLPPGAQRAYPVGGVIPADTPPGRYFLCARVDAGNKVTESNELNNAACWPIEIRGRR